MIKWMNLLKFNELNDSTCDDNMFRLEESWNKKIKILFKINSIDKLIKYLNE